MTRLASICVLLCPTHYDRHIFVGASVNVNKPQSARVQKERSVVKNDILHSAFVIMKIRVEQFKRSLQKTDGQTKFMVRKGTAGSCLKWQGQNSVKSRREEIEN